MEADLSDLSDSWRDMYSANIQINRINPFPFFRVHVKRIKIHLFEKKIEGRNGWIIVRKEVNGKPFVYSITDSPNILKYLIHKK